MTLFTTSELLLKCTSAQAAGTLEINSRLTWDMMELLMEGCGATMPGRL
jgi:hypothetical protein